MLMEHIDREVQVFLNTKCSRYAVPSHPISISIKSTTTELNSLVKDLLRSDSNETELSRVDFDFLIDHEYLVTSLAEWQREKDVYSESVHLEYIIRQQPPQPLEDIVQDDYISCVKRRGNYILTGSYDETIHLWSVDGRQPIATIPASDKVKCIDWITVDSDAGLATFVSGGFDQSLQLWTWTMTSAGPGRVACVILCKGHTELVTCCSGSAECGDTPPLLASGSWDKTIKVWSAVPEETDLSLETGGIAHKRKSANKIPVRIPRVTLSGHRGPVTRVAWTCNTHGRCGPPHLVSASRDCTIRLWDAGNGQEVRCVHAPCGIYTCDPGTGTDEVLAAGVDGRVRLFDLRAQEALVQVGFRGHTSSVTSIAWCPERTDKKFVTCSNDCSVKLWDLRNPKASLYDLFGHADVVTAVDWSSTRDYILTASADATVKVYRYI